MSRTSFAVFALLGKWRAPFLGVPLSLSPAGEERGMDRVGRSRVAQVLPRRLMTKV
jgi:hypothetical protein